MPSIFCTIIVVSTLVSFAMSETVGISKMGSIMVGGNLAGNYRSVYNVNSGCSKREEIRIPLNDPCNHDKVICKDGKIVELKSKITVDEGKCGPVIKSVSYGARGALRKITRECSQVQQVYDQCSKDERSEKDLKKCGTDPVEPIEYNCMVTYREVGKTTVETTTV